MRYEFATAGRIIVGPGCSAELAELAAGVGRRALLVQGQHTAAGSGLGALCVQALVKQGLVGSSYIVLAEPTIAVVEEGARLARAAGCDMVIGLGGGSVLDAAKACAALATNPGAALDYLEVIGAGKPLAVPALPIIAVPTTAGTGSEVTRNAVVTAPEQRVKASIRGPSLLPRIALVDSNLTHELPPEITASSGLDALTQLIEPYVSRRAQPLSDGLCLEGIARSTWALRRAYQQPDDPAAREALATASLMGGLALANAGLGAVHGIAAPIGGAYLAPHGAICAALLPHVTAINIRALRRRDPDGPALPRYARIAEVMLGRSSTTAALLAELVAALGDLVATLGIPALSSYGITPADIPGLAAQAAKASSTRGNPIELEQAELEEAINAALERMS